jgi:hypothetical protein
MRTCRTFYTIEWNVVFYQYFFILYSVTDREWESLQPIVIMPVANGILPKPGGGEITGMFIMENGGRILSELGIGRELMVCPFSVDEQELYPVGIVVRIRDMWEQTYPSETGGEVPVIMAVLEGRGHAKWHTLDAAGVYLVSKNVEFINLRAMRKEYPAISGAGWIPEGGYTEFRDQRDIPVTLYGTDIESGQKVSVSGNLGGLVELEQAHTIEHAMIRALRVYGLCTPKTLIDSIGKEADELKKSVEFSIKYTMPEVLGITSSGACGNPMTNLAQFYLTQNFVDNVSMGKSLNESIINARKSTMSQLVQDMDITMLPEFRALQGMKKGMSHDDTLVGMGIYKKVIGRFPFEPWD